MSETNFAKEIQRVTPSFHKQDIEPKHFEIYQVETDPVCLKITCNLCQTLPCCPEHCCDVSHEKC
jgi:hypothetical protein